MVRSQVVPFVDGMVNWSWLKLWLGGMPYRPTLSPGRPYTVSELFTETILGSIRKSVCDFLLVNNVVGLTNLGRMLVSLRHMA